MMPSSAWPNGIMRRHFATKRPSKKLDHKKIGPVRITALIGKRAVRVELPSTMRQHNVFNVVSLEPYRTSQIPGRRQDPSPPEVIDGEKFWVVESIAKSRLNRKAKRVEYLVFWQGYPPEEAHRKYPKQVKDPRVKLDTAEAGIVNPSREARSMN
jgi:hypothetical protein